jgi:AraC-like DNA-binding protein
VKGDEMSDRLFFSTDTVPEGDRFPVFCEEFIRRYTALDIKNRGESPFHGVIDLRRAGGVEVGVFATSPTDFIRAPHLVRDGDDGLIFMLSQGGVSYQTQLGYEHKLEAGEGITCDNGYSGAMHMVTDSRFWSLKVPRHRITSLLPHAGQLAGAKLDKDPVARRLLFGYLNETHDVNSTGGERAIQLYDEHIVNLLVLALGAERETREFVERRGVGAVRRAAILRAIETFMADPKLSATVIASRFGITPRYLRLLLEETGRSFSEHVLEKRLERSVELLRDPQQQDRKIAEIAFACGFGDLSYFNRVFRRRYGETPSDMRETARRQHRD